MKVCFVVNDLQLSGGVGVVVEHARRLPRHGIDASLVLARPQDDPDWSYPGLRELSVRSLEEARSERWDVAVATWWETCAALPQLGAGRRAHFVQSLEDRFYRPSDPHRAGAAASYELGLPVITEARWIAETLAEAEPGPRPLLVRNGIAKDVFEVPKHLDPRRHGPLRILVEGDPRVWFKGVGEALAATAQMHEPHHVTVVSGQRDGLEGADEVVGPLAPAAMAELYARTDVVLKLSRVEGMFGPPLEGFHLGATCVVSAVTGHEEYVEHGRNGLVVDWDDPRGTSRALDLLAIDRALLHELRAGALATARGWPSWDQAAAMMALALREVAQREPPAADPEAGRRFAAAHAAAISYREWGRRPKPLRRRVLDVLYAIARRQPLRWLLTPLRRLVRPGADRAP